MTDRQPPPEPPWEPGMPLHHRRGCHVRPMFTIEDDQTLTGSARWPDPHPLHDIGKEDA